MDGWYADCQYVKNPAVCDEVMLFRHGDSKIRTWLDRSICTKFVMW